MTALPDLEIHSSKLKLVRTLIIGCLFVVLGYYLFNEDAAQIESQHRFNSPVLVHSVGLVSMVFFGAAVVLILRSLFISAPMLVVNGNGIRYGQSPFPVTWVSWSDVAGFEARELHRQKLLYVLLRDRDRYVSQLRPWRQFVARLSRSLGPSPIVLSASTLQIDFDKLSAMLGDYYSAYRSDP
jgi:hypothetical protein